jgi:hypothetical protein
MREAIHASGGRQVKSCTVIREDSATAQVDLAVAMPQTFPGRPVDIVFIRNYLARAEALGFHSGWVVEQMLGPIPSLDLC